MTYTKLSERMNMWHWLGHKWQKQLAFPDLVLVKRSGLLNGLLLSWELSLVRQMKIFLNMRL
ncbi:hypothetical protein GCM10009861_24810 [Neomicrococcus aestuarii]